MITSLTHKLDGLYGRLYHSYFCFFSLLIAGVCFAFVMWDPKQLGQNIGGFTKITGPLMIWSICCGFIHGLGFKPNKLIFRIGFFPPLAWIFMLWILVNLSI